MAIFDVFDRQFGSTNDIASHANECSAFIKFSCYEFNFEFRSTIFASSWNGNGILAHKNSSIASYKPGISKKSEFIRGSIEDFDGSFRGVGDMMNVFCADSKLILIEERASLKWNA